MAPIAFLVSSQTDYMVDCVSDAIKGKERRLIKRLKCLIFLFLSCVYLLHYIGSLKRRYCLRDYL